MNPIHQKYSNGTGWKLQITVYVLCVLAGLAFMFQHSFSDSVALAGDEWEYQSIAVNMMHGHGFPVSGGYEDSAVYKMSYRPEVNGSQSWQNFYTSGRGYDFYRNPGYPLFIAAVYSICGISPESLRCIQFLLLILAGALLPYLCGRLSLQRGLVVGVLAYVFFLFLDYSYASDVMCEALIVVYTIAFVLAYIVSGYRRHLFSALALGLMMGVGLLLKNYYMPLFVLLLVHEFYLAFISKKVSKRNAIALLLGIMLTILPWSTYANHQLDKVNPGHPLIFITTQGDDVLLGSNNEYSADGLWHQEWTGHPESFYYKPGIKSHPGWWKVGSFYAHHLAWVPYFFSSKIMMGLFATLSQLAFYLSMLGFVILYYVRNRWLLLIPIAMLLLAVLATGGHVHGILIAISDSVLNTHHLMRYILIVITTVTTGLYYRIQAAQSYRLPVIFWLLLANFAVLTLIFYGNSRITGLADFVCLVFAFYNLSESIPMLLSDRKDNNLLIG